MITLSVMLATIIQTLDSTIANVALPHMQGSLSASADQITWVLTSYIVAAAIATPLTGWMCDRFTLKKVFLASVAGFTVASLLCGVSASLGEIVVARLLQGMFGAALVPLSQAVLLEINSPATRGSAMAMWGMGVMVGPILGPSLGGWLTDSYDWRWVFFLLRHLALHPAERRAADDALRPVRLRDPQPGHRRAADAARPRAGQRLALVHRDLGGAAAVRESPRPTSSSIPGSRRRSRPSSTSAC